MENEGPARSHESSTRREGPVADQLRAAMSILEKTQDIVTVLVGAGLILLAVVLLGAAVYDFL
ncbi:MAG: hypothetical protein JWM85_2058, partial [Acidimicrobiaceae bacterium]|nr:hypothetical protein [Acidimicrobiaceae bacterium]